MRWAYGATELPSISTCISISLPTPPHYNSSPRSHANAGTDSPDAFMAAEPVPSVSPGLIQLMHVIGFVALHLTSTFTRPMHQADAKPSLIINDAVAVLHLQVLRSMTHLNHKRPSSCLCLSQSLTVIELSRQWILKQKHAVSLSIELSAATGMAAVQFGSQ